MRSDLGLDTLVQVQKTRTPAPTHPLSKVSPRVPPPAPRGWSLYRQKSQSPNSRHSAPEPKHPSLGNPNLKGRWLREPIRELVAQLPANHGQEALPVTCAGQGPGRKSEMGLWTQLSAAVGSGAEGKPTSPYISPEQQVTLFKQVEPKATKHCQPVDPDASSNMNSNMLSQHRNPDPNWLIRSRKISISMTLILTFILIGLRNCEWLKGNDFPQKPRQLYDVIAEYGSRLYSYQARLRMAKEQLEFLKRESQILENNFREILILTEQIDSLKALLREMKNGVYNQSWNEDPIGKQDKDFINEEMSNLVSYVLKKLREDQVQMADYALKSAGGSIIEEGTSETYKNDNAKLSWHGVGFLNYEMPPDTILQPDVHPGKCWAFPGSRGHTLVKLARRIVPTAVTVEHISLRVSPSGNISSAPKEFSIYGISKECNGEEIFLGQFIYNKKETTVQTFELQHEASESLLCVKLKILSNWGHPNYTCLYRFRVHGNPVNQI
ncbi:SUN domain-containing protein 3 [Echinops telfairi]|uniref:SUN domain-containing protein 3 n=1 Tax=Echinops telfairi TaxID=9371 RepID=A0ABM0ZRQ7_ECHTE|nr:SUN domain-containing protein 3 [Echinops telfairi]